MGLAMEVTVYNRDRNHADIGSVHADSGTNRFTKGNTLFLGVKLLVSRRETNSPMPGNGMEHAG